MTVAARGIARRTIKALLGPLRWGVRGILALPVKPCMAMYAAIVARLART